ncbi:MAG: hypothetical protein ACJ73S_17895 [Mycobacteriales bacterium]
MRVFRSGGPIRFLVAALVAGFALMFGGASAAHAGTVHPDGPGATLTSASITFFTLDDDKDGDTQLTVQVLDNSGRAVAVFSGQPGLFDDQSTHTIPLRIRSGVSFDSLSAGHLRISIQPNGDDTWKFGFEQDLNFSDGDFIPTLIDRTSLSEDNKVFTTPLQF